MHHCTLNQNSGDQDLRLILWLPGWEGPEFKQRLLPKALSEDPELRRKLQLQELLPKAPWEDQELRLKSQRKMHWEGPEYRLIWLPQEESMKNTTEDSELKLMLTEFCQSIDSSFFYFLSTIYTLKSSHYLTNRFSILNGS